MEKSKFGEESSISENVVNTEEEKTKSIYERLESPHIAALGFFTLMRDKNGKTNSLGKTGTATHEQIRELLSGSLAFPDDWNGADLSDEQKEILDRISGMGTPMSATLARRYLSQARLVLDNPASKLQFDTYKNRIVPSTQARDNGKTFWDDARVKRYYK